MFRQTREDIKSIIKKDPAARNTWEVITCYPGFQAIFIHRMAHWCWLHGLKWLGRFISHLSRMLTAIEIHPAAEIGQRVFIDHGCGVVIGETAVVGNDCTIYHGVTLGGTTLTKGHKRHPTLGNGVIVGAGAKILGNFTIGDMAKVGSNAVVVKPVPPGATAVGNPARILVKEQEQSTDAASAVFSSYAITPNEDDPLIKALRSLINNSAAQEKQIENIMSALDSAQIPLEKLNKKMVDTEQISKLVE